MSYSQKNKETKREKSIRLMKKRIDQAGRNLEKISNLSTAHYSYTKEELDSMISFVESKSSYVIECLKRRQELNRRP